MNRRVPGHGTVPQCSHAARNRAQAALVNSRHFKLHYILAHHAPNHAPGPLDGAHGSLLAHHELALNAPAIGSTPGYELQRLNHAKHVPCLHEPAAGHERPGEERVAREEREQHAAVAQHDLAHGPGAHVPLLSGHVRAAHGLPRELCAEHQYRAEQPARRGEEEQQVRRVQVRRRAPERERAERGHRREHQRHRQRAVRRRLLHPRRKLLR
mmetsp:Transcript_134933/g.200748  ORF Transcript_134933/g.200748 Transcript_134933/m.200748 type:complete len:212 (+) Transcript_134933:72-707(+)